MATVVASPSNHLSHFGAHPKGVGSPTKVPKPTGLTKNGVSKVGPLSHRGQDLQKRPSPPVKKTQTPQAKDQSGSAPARPKGEVPKKTPSVAPKAKKPAPVASKTNADPKAKTTTSQVGSKAKPVKK